MKKGWHLTVVVMAMAFLIGLNIVGIMPVLSMIADKYPDRSTGTVQLLQTIHYALLIVGSLSVGFLASRFSEKKVVLGGTLIIGVSGILPFFIESFALLFACRILIGMGFGIVSPMITAVITKFSIPEKRAGYMGLNVVAMGISGMVGNLIGGMLAKNGLRYFFLIYLMVIVCGILILMYLPDTAPAAGQAKSATGSLKPIVFALSTMTFLHAIFITAYSTNISLFITAHVTSDPGASGLATAVNALCAMILGMFFSKVLNFLKRASLPSAALMAALGFVAILLIPGMPGILICSGLCGMSLSCFSAAGAYMVSVSVKPEEIAGASGIYNVFNSIGGLIAPFILGGAAAVMGGNTPDHQFIAAFVGMLVLGIAIFAFIFSQPMPE